jgi:hypothetical protein
MGTRAVSIALHPTRRRTAGGCCSRISSIDQAINASVPVPFPWYQRPYPSSLIAYSLALVPFRSSLLPIFPFAKDLFLQLFRQSLVVFVLLVVVHLVTLAAAAYVVVLVLVVAERRLRHHVAVARVGLARLRLDPWRADVGGAAALRDED